MLLSMPRVSQDSSVFELPRFTFELPIFSSPQARRPILRRVSTASRDEIR